MALTVYDFLSVKTVTVSDITGAGVVITGGFGTCFCGRTILPLPTVIVTETRVKSIRFQAKIKKLINGYILINDILDIF